MFATFEERLNLLSELYRNLTRQALLIFHAPYRYSTQGYENYYSVVSGTRFIRFVMIYSIPYAD